MQTGPGIPPDWWWSTDLILGDVRIPHFLHIIITFSLSWLPCNFVYHPPYIKCKLELINVFQVGLFLSTPVQKPPSSLPDNLTDSWEDIRKLDEEELWIERTQVVTKEDHLLYFEIAKVVYHIISQI
jgi:hypothetical protein